jgi:hypothetical protein
MYKECQTLYRKVTGEDFVNRAGALIYLYVFLIPSGLIQEWYIVVRHDHILLIL